MFNTTTTVPAGCTKLYAWEDRDGEPVRPFRGTAGAVIETVTGTTIEVFVEGVQTVDGVSRMVVFDDREVSTDQVRVLVAALGAVLEEVSAPSKIEAPKGKSANAI